jgi:DNA polymerase-3 subunit beta
LVRGSQIIQFAYSPRTALPILSNFLLEVEDRKIKFVSTDLKISVTHYLKADVQGAQSLAVPIKKFSDILQTLPAGQDIELSFETGNKIKIKHGRSQFGLVGAAKSEYPVLPEFNQKSAFEVPAGQIYRMIQKTIFAASPDETRPTLNGVLWSAEGGVLEFAATDGRRLALTVKKILPKEVSFRVISPIKILSGLMHILEAHEVGLDSTEKILISISENQFAFRFKETTMLSRLVSGEFPQYKQVIPVKSDIRVLTRVADLSMVTKRAALCVTDRGEPVKYSFNRGEIQVSATGPNMDFHDSVPAEYEGSPFNINFDPRFVLEALKYVDGEKVVLGMTTSSNPALLTPEGEVDYKFVIMPMHAG